MQKYIKIKKMSIKPNETKTYKFYQYKIYKIY